MQQRGRWPFVEQGEKMGGLTALLHFLECSPDSGSCCLALPASRGPCELYSAFLRVLWKATPSNPVRGQQYSPCAADEETEAQSMVGARPQEPGRREAPDHPPAPGKRHLLPGWRGSRAVRWPLGHGKVDTWEGAWPGRAAHGPKEFPQVLVAGAPAVTH